MSHEELIQTAIKQLKRNKVEDHMLESPRVRNAVVVYFKIQPKSNAMLVLDSETGEQITAHFSSGPFLEQYMSHCNVV